MLGESIAAKNENVAVLERAGYDFELRIVLNSHRAGDYIVRPILDFFGGYRPTRQHLLDLGVVARHLLDRVAPCKVETAVTGPQTRIVVLGNEQDCDRGSDDGTAALTAQLDDLAICDQEPVLRFREQLDRGARSGDRVESLDDELARHVPRFVSSHAVGNGPKAHVGPYQMGILVSRPDLALMCGGTRIECEKRLVHRDSAPPAMRHSRFYHRPNCPSA